VSVVSATTLLADPHRLSRADVCVHKWTAHNTGRRQTRLLVR
jgi:hypothetical protein